MEKGTRLGQTSFKLKLKIMKMPLQNAITKGHPWRIDFLDLENKKAGSRRHFSEFQNYPFLRN